MAYSSTGLSTVNASKRGNAPGIYAYKTTDAIADSKHRGLLQQHFRRSGSW